MVWTIFAFIGWAEYKKERWINYSVWGSDWSSEFPLEAYSKCQSWAAAEPGVYWSILKSQSWAATEPCVYATGCYSSLSLFFQNEIIQCHIFQAILIAHKRQMETEENLYQTAQSEQDSYERELRLINKAFHELGERHFRLQVCQELQHLSV
jgi:hypothetical protein